MTAAPLTPPDCNCQGLPFMPLEVVRLVDSDLVALSTGDEFKAAVILWAKSWTQVPAASVPDDDRILARWCGYSLAEWSGLREMALKNWVKCSDGRLYHPLIADLAVKTMEKRKGQVERANTRWAKARAEKSASAMPVDEKVDATASEIDAGVMQGRGTVEGTEPPTVPPGDETPEFDLTPPDEKPVDPVEQAFDAWNDLARRRRLPIAKGLDKARRRAIGKRLEEGGLEGWGQAMEGVDKSAFLLGQRPGSDGRTFRADLGFVCQAKSYPRLREGSYGDDAKPTPGTAPAAKSWPGPPDLLAAIIAETDDAFARSYVVPSGWRNGPERVVVCRNEFAAEKLRTKAPAALARFQVRAVVEASS